MKALENYYKNINFIQILVLKQLVKYPDIHLLWLENKEDKETLLEHVATSKRDGSKIKIVKYHMMFI